MAAAGRMCLSPAATEVLSREYVEGPTGALSKLSPQERRVLQRLTAGLSSKGIAAELNLSVRTVEAHRASIIKKLGIPSVAGLTRFAIRSGLVSEI
jgi:DNA-binding NarL/FixJ family response regulator